MSESVAYPGPYVRIACAFSLIEPKVHWRLGMQTYKGPRSQIVENGESPPHLERSAARARRSEPADTATQALAAVADMSQTENHHTGARAEKGKCRVEPSQHDGESRRVANGTEPPRGPCCCHATRQGRAAALETVARMPGTKATLSPPSESRLGLDPGALPTGRETIGNNEYRLAFVDAAGRPIDIVRLAEMTPPCSLGSDYFWRSFNVRVPYDERVRAIELYENARVRDRLSVGHSYPQFFLERSAISKTQDTRDSGRLLLQWRLGRQQDLPCSFDVRYSANGLFWRRLAVRLSGPRFEYDVARLGGGPSCTLQLLGTSGYHTGVIDVPSFSIPLRPPEVWHGSVEGPCIYAQGFSLQEGPILAGEGAWWTIDGATTVRDQWLDLRSLPPGMHEISFSVRDNAGLMTVKSLGFYVSPEGRPAPKAPAPALLRRL